jgi:hypothetical protein
MATIADAIGGLRNWLALTWLLDAVLQYQPFMFSKAFSQMLSGAGQGNPHVIAQPISWAAGIVADRPILVNAVFATIQLLLATGIIWRCTTKIALVASIAWSLGVWWFGEGFGGVLAGTASPVNGAPGAVILYALLAVLVCRPASGIRVRPSSPPVWWVPGQRACCGLCSGAAWPTWR